MGLASYPQLGQTSGVEVVVWSNLAVEVVGATVEGWVTPPPLHAVCESAVATALHQVAPPFVLGPGWGGGAAGDEVCLAYGVCSTGLLLCRWA